MNVNQCNGAGSYTNWHQIDRKPATPIHDSNILAFISVQFYDSLVVTVTIWLCMFI